MRRRWSAPGRRDQISHLSSNADWPDSLRCFSSHARASLDKLGRAPFKNCAGCTAEATIVARVRGDNHETAIEMTEETVGDVDTAPRRPRRTMPPGCGTPRKPRRWMRRNPPCRRSSTRAPSGPTETPTTRRSPCSTRWRTTWCSAAAITWLTCVILPTPSARPETRAAPRSRRRGSSPRPDARCLLSARAHRRRDAPRRRALTR